MAETRRRIEELRESERARHRELDVLTFEIEEISRAQPTAGESESLRRDADRLENAEKLAGGLENAVAALRDEGRAEDLLGEAESEVRSLSGFDPALTPLAE